MAPIRWSSKTCRRRARGAGEVVVDVKAAGVNFPDVLMIQGKYQVKPPLPFTPGVELAGIVTGDGERRDACQVR